METANKVVCVLLIPISLFMLILILGLSDEDELALLSLCLFGFATVGFLFSAIVSPHQRGLKVAAIIVSIGMMVWSFALGGRNIDFDEISAFWPIPSLFLSSVAWKALKGKPLPD